MSRNEKDTSTDLEYVRAVLRRWDPIAVIDLLKEDGLPLDEYDAYAPELLFILNRGGTVEDVRGFFVQARMISMGLGEWRYTELEHTLAEELVRWRQESNSR